MADEDTQSREESLWWAGDASSDSSPTTATFDEPLEWPDALPWEEFDAGQPEGDGFPDPDHLSFDLLFPPADAATVVDAGRPAAGSEADGGGEGDGDPTALHVEPLPDSIWAADAPPDDDAPPRLVTITGSISADGPAAGALYAEAERPGGARWPAWLAVPRGNVTVIALISVASLVLLGMFLSVRSRNSVPTDTSRTRTTQAGIAANRPLDTVPLNTATTAAPPSTIVLSDLVPPPDPPAADTEAGSPAAATTPRTAAPATTVPRSSAPAGGGGGSATQPTTVTTAAPAPAPPPDTTPPATSPPNDDTTPTTRRSTQSSIDFPWPTSSVPSTSFPRPTVTWPTGFAPNPG